MIHIKNQAEHNYKGESSVFLATTALEDFWDTSKPMVFLGEWCRRYSRRASWEKLNAVVLPSPFKDMKKLHDAYLYSSDVYERTLKELVCVLNKIHGKNYSERYWRIVIGPWLFHYIDVLYDRYTTLKIAFSKYPDLVTIGLAEECFLTVKDTLSHHKLLGDDLYNLQIYTRILDELGKKYQIIKKDLSTNDENLRSQDFSSKFNFHLRNILRNYLHFFCKLGYMQKFNIISHASFFSSYVDLILFFKTSGRFRPFIKKLDDIEFVAIDKSIRSRIKIGGIRNNEFEITLGHMLPHDMPQCFLETYDSIKREVQKKYPSYPNVIFSSVSYYFDEYFKQWAAKSAEKGTVLIGIQHGGNYGSDAFIRAMDHEIAITDRFYSWGWNLAEPHSKIFPMPATKLTGRNTIGADNQKEGVLFAGTAVRRYLYRIQIFNNEAVPDYINWQFRFFKSVSTEIQTKMRVRLFQVDYGLDLYDRWKDRFSNVIIESWERPFLKSMNNCRLFVCDHLSTVHAEALSANKPTILFWDPLIFTLNQEAMPYYDELRSTGILHDSPESAADTLNHVYDDIEGWWNTSERQNVLKRFCNRFARTSANAINEWANELNRIDKWAENDKRK